MKRKKTDRTEPSKPNKPNRIRGDGPKALLAAFLSTVTSLVAALLVCLLLGAAYIESRPDLFSVDLSRFTAPQSTAPSTLYVFPAGAKDPVPDYGAAVPYVTLTGGDRTRYVPLSEIPEDLRNAFVAIEDKRFYTHRGVDLKRTAAAVLSYLLKRGRSFGGSTVTQQLVKNVTGESERTPMRKVTEIFRALDLERNLSKDEILEQYLNLVPLANRCRGVGAAAEYYFSRPPASLTLAECATLAAITQNPTRYDPIRHPEENRKRRDTVLSEMLAQGYIEKEAYEAAVSTPVETAVTEPTAPSAPTSWYTDLVIEDVIRDLTAKYGCTRAEASHLLYCGGLRIDTLMDPDLQSTVEAYYRDLSHFPRLENGKTPQSGMVLLDPKTGNLLAVAGAIGEKTGDRIYNFATDAHRPPGSVLKPLTVYAPAVEDGKIGYATVYDDVPVRFTARKDGSLSAWPHNASGVYRGLVNVDFAVRNSLNTVAVRVLEDVGIDRAFDFAKNTLGISSLVEHGKHGERGVTDRGTAALALGQMTYGATLREITAAYTAFTSGGIYRNARTYARVTDSRGNVLLENRPTVRPALSEETAELMTKLLENVTENGTARTLTLTDRTAVAGKTGTTQYSFDRWFVGYTPDLLAGVWYGCASPESLESVKGNPALSVWDGVMGEIYETVLTGDRAPRAREFAYPRLRAVRVCADSGLLPSDACALDPRGDRSTVAYFTESTLPTAHCRTHVKVLYCGSGDDPADGVVTDPATFGFSDLPLRRVSLLRVNRRFPTDLFVGDAQYTAAPSTPLPHASDPTKPYYADPAAPEVFYGKSYVPFPFNRPATRSFLPEKPQNGDAEVPP